MSVMEKIESLISNDSYAMSFQSMGAYRAALLAEIKAITDMPKAAPPVSNEFVADGCGGVGWGT